MKCIWDAIFGGKKKIRVFNALKEIGKVLGIISAIRDRHRCTRPLTAGDTHAGHPAWNMLRLQRETSWTADCAMAISVFVPDADRSVYRSRRTGRAQPAARLVRS